MKNKQLLYGLLGVGAIVGFYFWNKNKKSTTESLVDDSKKSAFSNEEIEKLSKEFADEFVSEAKKEITRLELKPIEPKVAIQNNTNGLSILDLENIYVKNKKDSLKNQSKENLQRISNSYGNLYKSFKKSIPNFDNLSDLTMAKNILLKVTILGDNKAVLTKEEQIFLANAESNKNIMKFGGTVGFDMSDIFPKGTKTAEMRK